MSKATTPKSRTGKARKRAKSRPVERPRTEASLSAQIPPGATRFPRAECSGQAGREYSVELSVALVEAIGHRHGGAMPGLWIDRPRRTGLPANSAVSWQVQFPSFASKLRLSYAFSGACGGVRQNEVTVGTPGLVELPASADYRLVEADAAHPRIHFGQPAVVEALRRIAARFHRDRPGSPVPEIGRMSLPLGGIFDFGGDWRTSAEHLGHDSGYEADVLKPRAAADRAALVALIRANGGIVAPDRHADFYHISFSPGGARNSLGEQIVADYRASTDPRPGGKCYPVSYARVNAAVKRVCGAALPPLDAAAPFDRLWASKIGPRASWRKLDPALRGKGAAGAMASIGMGDLVEPARLWTGGLRPGAVLQLWREAGDYERVRDGDEPVSYGHSVVFLEYVESGGKILGMKVADQGTIWSEPQTLRREAFHYAVGANLHCKNEM